MAGSSGWRRWFGLLVILPGLSFFFGAWWYFDWLVVQGYPPLRIASIELGLLGLIGLPLGVATRRKHRRQYDDPERKRDLPEPFEPRLRDWIIGALYGLLFIPLSTGMRSLALTRLPIAVVAIVVSGSAAWRLVLVRRWPGPAALATVVLLAAALALVTTGPDATEVTVLALLVVASFVAVAGRLVRKATSTEPLHQLWAIGMVTAAIALQIAGIMRGEQFGDAPLRSTLALFAPLGLIAAFIGLGLLAGAPHLDRIVMRVGACGGLLIILLLGETWADQHVATSTWIAAALVAVAHLIEPPELGDERKL